jgi:hypothetical protein
MASTPPPSPYPYYTFMILTCACSVYLFGQCGTYSLACKCLYALGVTTLLYVAADTLISDVREGSVCDKRTQRYAIHAIILLIVLSLYTHNGLIG